MGWPSNNQTVWATNPGTPASTAGYDAVIPGKLEYANRRSYVIAPNGEIIYEYTALDPSGHVANTLAAVEKWKAAQK